MAKVNFEQWNGFKGDRWKEKIDVRNFISMNYTPYDGDVPSWKDLQRLQINSGVNFSSFRKRNVQKAAFSIWRQR